MTAQQAFEPILDSDETIVESFRPNRFRFIGLGIIADLLKGLIIAGFGGVVFAFSYIGEWVDDSGATVDSIIPRIIGIVIFCFAFLIVLIAVVWRAIRYNKTFFAYSNKRVLIRTGFIGADFQTLDFDLIGAMNVRVDFFDKLVHPNTGTLMFASAASPMMANGLPGGMSGYMFVDIEDPYGVYKRVKEYAANNKDGQLNS